MEKLLVLESWYRLWHPSWHLSWFLIVLQLIIFLCWESQHIICKSCFIVTTDVFGLTPSALLRISIEHCFSFLLLWKTQPGEESDYFRGGCGPALKEVKARTHARTWDRTLGMDAPFGAFILPSHSPGPPAKGVAPPLTFSGLALPIVINIQDNPSQTRPPTNPERQLLDWHFFSCQLEAAESWWTTSLDSCFLGSFPTFLFLLGDMSLLSSLSLSSHPWFCCISSVCCVSDLCFYSLLGSSVTSHFSLGLLMVSLIYFVNYQKSSFLSMSRIRSIYNPPTHKRCYIVNTHLNSMHLVSPVNWNPLRI